MAGSGMRMVNLNVSSHLGRCDPLRQAKELNAMTTNLSSPLSASEWQREVFPHSTLRALAPDLWIVRGEFPHAQLPRTMVVYRYGADQLLLHSVIALDERTMRELEALGRPAIM